MFIVVGSVYTVQSPSLHSGRSIYPHQGRSMYFTMVDHGRHAMY